ncbi:2-dehydropantoate 2-reductase [Cytobacillus eiseniae]|uniref:2-dehydropantoate 2-reductase n=1 Tax=Cytobacillus eiseniae TaxID=762947 RepID=A0ABS4RAV6_9BACI|nr:2-dehydropantoate 2-reductase [Cytobacillus eiseniae]MBP2240023.1 2-dehydropantoate 2-reductase [Cytobacillus eiseniae]
MKIGIIGGGSIGLLLAHYLMKQHDVCVYVRSIQQMQRLKSEGLLFEKDQKCDKEILNATLFSNWTGEEELTIIAVKQYQLSPVLAHLTVANTNKKAAFLFLQNGMGHLKELKDIEVNNILVGTVEHGANKLNVNHVIHTGEGLINIALFRGEFTPGLTDLFESPINHFPFVIKDSYLDMLSKKLIVNAVINPLTAALNVSNGTLIENPHYYSLFKKLYKEVSSVIRIREKEKAFAYVEDICRKTAANRSSMLKDIDENRLTEIDAILGYVLEQAKKKEIATPISAFLFEMIKGKEY